jgi:site-specific recombinase XerC
LVFLSKDCKLHPQARMEADCDCATRGWPLGVEGRHPMGQRQLNRLLKLWVVEAGLDPSDYSVESLRRTKALHILKGTGDLQTVRALLGHARIESTALPCTN